MSDDGKKPTVRPEDALQVAQRALAKANALEDENEELRERIVELEARQSSSDDYATLDRDEKVGMVREELVKRARAQHGRAAMDYDDVMWGVFDGEPSADHCYTLMQLAANAEGYDLRDPDGGNREVTVDLDAAKDATGFSRANKDFAEGGR